MIVAMGRTGRAGTDLVRPLLPSERFNYDEHGIFLNLKQAIGSSHRETKLELRISEPVEDLANPRARAP